MEIAEYYLSLSSYLNRRRYFDPKSKTARRLLSYILTIMFVGLVSFVSLSVNRFINNTMSISVSEPDTMADTQESIDVFVKKGDTLQTVLTKQKLPSKDIKAIVSALQTAAIKPSLKVGQKISLNYETDITENGDEDLSSETQVLNQIAIFIDHTRRIEITKGEDGWFAEDITVPLKRVLATSSVAIKGSFIQAAKSLGISTNNILELIHAYSYYIDFERQIKSGDTLTFFSEKFFTEDGKLSHHGKVLFASMNLSGKEYKIYRYSPDGSEKTEYFSEDGNSAKRNLLKTPLNVARVSSKFGHRKDPVHGFSAMHTGVDFRAPIGTPIYAAGTGIVTECGWKRGYGKFVQIKHSGTLSTAYAHASNFAKNLKVGSKVTQGQVIAYVGKTGRATGAHLHFEVKINGRHVNPMSIKTTPGTKLQGKQLHKFEKFKEEMHLLSKKTSSTQSASL